MCDTRGEKFVVPVLPAARMGWWIGEVIGESGDFYQVAILRSDRNNGDFLGTTKKYVREFDTLPDAISHLESKGVRLLS